jgi:hypothetical protein
MPVQYERTARAAGNAIILIQKLKFKSQKLNSSFALVGIPPRTLLELSSNKLVTRYHIIENRTLFASIILPGRRIFVPRALAMAADLSPFQGYLLVCFNRAGGVSAYFIPRQIFEFSRP